MYSLPLRDFCRTSSCLSSSWSFCSCSLCIFCIALRVSISSLNLCSLSAASPVSFDFLGLGFGSGMVAERDFRLAFSAAALIVLDARLILLICLSTPPMVCLADEVAFSCVAVRWRLLALTVPLAQASIGPGVKSSSGCQLPTVVSATVTPLVAKLSRSRKVMSTTARASLTASRTA